MKQSILGVFALVAGALLAFAGKPAEKDPNSLQLEWRYQPQGSSTDPTDPDNYQSGSVDECDGDSDICGIEAPADMSGNHPVINSQLESRILAEDTSDGDVFLKN